MNILFDIEATQAAFSVAACDGGFDSDFAHYLAALGATRPSVVLTFPPKAAGTFLRGAAILSTQGALVRTVHAQGGRDASFYLPTFLLYYAGGFPDRAMVTHVHMQALPANRHFIEAFGLRPAIMLRAIPDMLASYGDMLEEDHLSPDNWLNAQVPAHFGALDQAAKGDFLIDMFGPWYASYYATWMEYAAQAPGAVLVLDYDGFCADPVTTLERLLNHSGLPQPRAKCQAALEHVWEDRAAFRFNKGISGRGARRFTAAQIDRLRRQIGYYPGLAEIAERLIPLPSGVSQARGP